MIENSLTDAGRYCKKINRRFVSKTLYHSFVQENHILDIFQKHRLLPILFPFHILDMFQKSPQYQEFLSILMTCRLCCFVLHKVPKPYSITGQFRISLTDAGEHFKAKTMIIIINQNCDHESMKTMIRIEPQEEKTTKILALHLPFSIHKKLDVMVKQGNAKGGKISKRIIAEKIIEANIDDVVIE